MWGEKLIIEIIRYLFGYIKFRAEGGFADRFINLCTGAGIPLWNVQNIGGKITACTTIEGYLSIRPIAKKSGMRVRTVAKRGIIFILKRNKLRTGLLAGVVASIAVIALLSQFVWSVSVVGNTSLDEDFLLEKFAEYGVCVGSKISKIDTEKATLSVMTEVEKLSWASVNIKGSVLVVEVRERTDIPEIYDAATPTNLVASDDGVILSLDILNGVEEVKVGSAVVKGDLLISGFMAQRDGSEFLVHADGYVKALVKKRAEFSASDFEFCTMKNEKSRFKIFFFGAEIPLGKKGNGEIYNSHKSFIKNDEMLLPMGIITEYSAEFNEEKTIEKESLSNKLAILSQGLYVKDLLENSNIRKSNLSVSIGEFGENYEFYAECEQEIGTLQEIYVEKTDDIA